MRGSWVPGGKALTEAELGFTIGIYASGVSAVRTDRRERVGLVRAQTAWEGRLEGKNKAVKLNLPDASRTSGMLPSATSGTILADENIAELGQAVEPIPKVDLTEEVIRRIKLLLVEGKIKPGSKLPPERELSEMLGISRPSLRQGLKALRMISVIESRRRHGTFVSDSTAEVLQEPLDFVMLLNAITIEELFEVRRVIEVELAGLAAVRGTNEELRAIKACISRQQADLDAPEKFLAEDIAFHMAIAAAAHNVLFGIFLESIARLLREQRRALLDTEDKLSKSYRDHVAIWEKLRVRDAVGARKMMLNHLERVYDVWHRVHRKQATRHVLRSG